MILWAVIELENGLSPAYTPSYTPAYRIHTHDPWGIDQNLLESQCLRAAGFAAFQARLPLLSHLLCSCFRPHVRTQGEVATVTRTVSGQCPTVAILKINAHPPCPLQSYSQISCIHTEYISPPYLATIREASFCACNSYNSPDDRRASRFHGRRRIASLI
jgi:hypothetical protein